MPRCCSWRANPPSLPITDHRLGEYTIRIFGLDVTSRPSARKPITCAVCHFDGTTLRLESMEPLASFEAFDAMLQWPGPWVAGLDFPFGQPRRLVEDLGWPADWEGYVGRVARMTPQEFALALRSYWTPRPAGQKHLFRRADRLSRACSPMMLDFTPVAKMFHRLAPRLMQSGVSVIPCRPNGSDRIAVEAYPGVLARTWIGPRSYKSETRKRHTPERLTARRDIVAAVESKEFAGYYGFACSCGGMHDELARDPKADTLDAFLSAVQAAWAYARRQSGYGMPSGQGAADCDPLEGCIADPICAGLSG